MARLHLYVAVGNTHHMQHHIIIMLVVVVAMQVPVAGLVVNLYIAYP